MTRRRRGTQRVTMEDVARLASVSPSTVSLYLRRPAEVSPVRAQTIQAAIDRLGYLPNTMAGGLASSRSKIIGVLVPTITNSFFSETLETLEHHLRRAGYQLLIGNTEFDVEREEELLRSLMSWNPAGLVLTGFAHNRKTRALLLNSEVPIVEMWDYGSPGLDMVVGFSHFQCGRLMAEHFLAAGYRQVAFISTRFARDIRAHDRYEGFRQCMEEAGAHVVKKELAGRSDTRETGDIMHRLMVDEPEIEAVACSNDMVALGVMLECQRQGWAIPHRVAVAGFGNQDFTGSTVPPMTTIEPPRQAIGENIARLLINRLRGESCDQTLLDLGVRLIAREST
ncbi:LacI family DNA-binding transcriptional regulator [uncultured Kushneria sp.]|uniref:LacI family DNA-binding transcriptional regulator n=1 Tax=uncultured Kushneria sp. TaxID=905033 RepID=UPI00262D24EE|nr:LacI family DNA-binding transcriptional regulator [uncultured Kushneria sp.]